jgi:4-oxalocrotonate tautomerase
MPLTRKLSSASIKLNQMTKEPDMSLINVKLIEGVFSEPQKKQIQKSLTEALVQIEGEAMRSVTWCVVEEVKSGDWAIGGQPLTAADVKAIAAKRAA